MLRDHRQAWDMQSEGSYRQRLLWRQLLHRGPLELEAFHIQRAGVFNVSRTQSHRPNVTSCFTSLLTACMFIFSRATIRVAAS
jgi:hypothetical protein